MAVTNLISSYRNVGDGVSRRFVFPFRVLEESHIGVVLTAVNGKVSDGILVAGGTFTWGAETPNAYRVLAGFESGDSFTLEFGIAPAAGTDVRAFRRMPMVQPATFNSSDLLNAKALETALDRIVMLVQQLQDGLPSGVYVDPSLGTLPYGMLYESTVRAVADVRPQSVDGAMLRFAAGAQFIDGHALQFGETVLCCGQASPVQNGPWQVTTVGTATTGAVWTRPAYFQGTVRNGLLFLIRQGVNFNSNVLGVYSTSRLDSTVLVGATQLTVAEVIRQVNPTIAVGETVTIEAGLPAAVVNRGTPRDMLLEFRIPRGLDGFIGMDGASGKDGKDGKDGRDGKGLVGCPFAVTDVSVEGGPLQVKIAYCQITGIEPQGMALGLDYVISVIGTCMIYAALEWDTANMVLQSGASAIRFVQSAALLANTETIQYELIASVVVAGGVIAQINNVCGVPVPDAFLLKWS